MKLALIAVPVAASMIVLLLLFSLIPFEYWYILLPGFLRTADVSVWRGIDCTTDCSWQVDPATISKYPELQIAMEQIDQKYDEQFSKACDTDRCLNEQFTYERIRFTMRADIASRMSQELESAGATMGSACFEGGCHSLYVNIGNATYDIGFNFR